MKMLETLRTIPLAIRGVVVGGLIAAPLIEGGGAQKDSLALAVIITPGLMLWPDRPAIDNTGAELTRCNPLAAGGPKRFPPFLTRAASFAGPQEGAEMVAERERRNG